MIDLFIGSGYTGHMTRTGNYHVKPLPQLEKMLDTWHQLALIHGNSATGKRLRRLHDQLVDHPPLATSCETIVLQSPQRAVETLLRFGHTLSEIPGVMASAGVTDPQTRLYAQAAARRSRLAPKANAIASNTRSGGKDAAHKAVPVGSSL
jgi:hypothetical protein